MEKLEASTLTYGTSDSNKSRWVSFAPLGNIKNTQYNQTEREKRNVTNKEQMAREGIIEQGGIWENFRWVNSHIGQEAIELNVIRNGISDPNVSLFNTGTTTEDLLEQKN